MLFDLIKMYVAKSMTKILQCKEWYVLENWYWIIYTPHESFLSGAKTYYFKFHQGHTYRGAYAPTPWFNSSGDAPNAPRLNASLDPYLFILIFEICPYL